MRAKNLFFVVTALVGMMLAGCTKSDVPTPGTSEVSISLDRQTMILPVGKSATLEVIVHPETAATPALAWSSEYPSIATVDDSGVVTGVSVGETTVVVSTEDGEYREECKVTVVNDMETFIKQQIRTAMFDMGATEEMLGQTGWTMDNPLEQWQIMQVEPADEAEIGYWVDLYVYDYILNGELSVALFSIPGLRSIDISYNNLTGPIPTEIGNAKYLSYIALGSNNLTGPIPVEIGNLKSLSFLCIHGNNLTGSIPAELGDLELLETLCFHSNNLTGSIPAALGNLELLTELRFDDNNLTGSIPAELTT